MEPKKPLPTRKRRGRRGTGIVSLGQNFIKKYTNSSDQIVENRQTVQQRTTNNSVQLPEVDTPRDDGNTKILSNLLKKQSKTLDKLHKGMTHVVKFVKVISKGNYTSQQLSNKGNIVKNSFLKFGNTIMGTGGNKKQQMDTSVEGLKGINDDKKRLLKITRDKGFVRKLLANLAGNQSGLLAFIMKMILALLPAIISGIMGMVGGLAGGIGGMVPAVLAGLTGAMSGLVTLLGGLLVAAAGAGLGYSIWKLFVEPFFEKAEKQAMDHLAKPGIKAGQIVTDTGEKVYERTENATGKKTYVTEKEMQQELDNMTEEQRNAVADGTGPISYTPAKNVKDTASGRPMGETIPSGVSIEEINKQSQKQQNAKQKMSPEQLEFNSLAEQIARFDGQFRSMMVAAMDIISESPSGPFGTSSAYLQMGAVAAARGLLEPMLLQHQTLIDKIRRSELPDGMKKELVDSSPLFVDSLKKYPLVGYVNNPDMDTAFEFSYDLPSGVDINLLDWLERPDLAKRGATTQENRQALDDLLGFDPNVNFKRQQTSVETPRGNIASVDLQQTPTTQQPAKIASMSGSASQTAPVAIKSSPSNEQLTYAPQQPVVAQMSGTTPSSTTASPKSSVINNYYNNISSGGNGRTIMAGNMGISKGSAISPDESGMAAVLTREAARSAGVGGVTG